MFCTCGPNLVIVAWAGDKLSSGQTDDWRTHTHTYTHTHRQTQATTIPEGHNWPRVKIIFHRSINHNHKLMLLVSFITWRRVSEVPSLVIFGNKNCISKMIKKNQYVWMHITYTYKNQVNPNKSIFVRVGGMLWTFFARYPKFQAINAEYTWTLSINVHPSPKVMADFSQIQKLAWRPHQICIYLVGA